MSGRVRYSEYICADVRRAHAWIESVRPYILVVIVAIGWIGCSKSALSADAEIEDGGKPLSTWPNTYLDLRTNYSTLPSGTLSIGFSNPSLSSAIATLQSLSALAGNPSRLKPSLPSSKSVGIDVPLTIDLNDRVSVYGGFSAATSKSGMSEWSMPAIESWSFGFQADIYQQQGGKIPSIALQSTLTRSVPDAPLATTSVNTVVESNYALNDEETRGLLFGVQYTTIVVDSPLARINPNIIGYAGGYYQGLDNWKISGRVGVQSFGGAQLLNLTPVAAFTQPIVRFDVDRNDENDNRLFGVTAQISWTPKPAYQLTIRTPLYLVRK